MPTTPPAAPRGRPAPLRAEVRRVELRSPRIRRVVLGGGELDQFFWPGPASHLKLILPLPGESEPSLPTPGPDGLVAYDRSKIIMRTYTPRAWDSQAKELTIDIFVHSEGPASLWAAGAQPGDVVAVSRPRARYDADPEAPWLVLAGDETAVPAIGTILESLPSAIPTAVVIESDGDDDDLGLPAGTETTFVRRSDTPGYALLAAVTDAVTGADGKVWVAGEARDIRRIRAQLLHELRLPAASVVTRGYWRQGEADHPDHDFGEA